MTVSVQLIWFLILLSQVTAFCSLVVYSVTGDEEFPGPSSWAVLRYFLNSFVYIGFRDCFFSVVIEALNLQQSHNIVTCLALLVR